MATTTNFGIPLLEQGQAQKEVTINEAIGTFDAILKGSVLDKDLATPPGSPAQGDAYIVAASPTGAWASKAKAIAYYDQVWRFIAPQSGLRLWVRDEQCYYQYSGAAWTTSNPTITGNASTATALQTPRTINGVAFDGTANITISASMPNLTGEVTSVGAVTTVTNAAVIGKVLTGYTSGSGTVSSADTILQAVQKLNGNVALKAPLTSPTFTGTVTLPAGQVVNGVTLTTGGGTTNFLRADGTYAAPASSSGTVTGVSVTTANGVSGSVATSTTTPAISLTLGNITPTSVAAAGTVTGSNLSGTNTGDQTITLTGDVTGTGTGSFGASIGANKVTNSHLAQVATASFKGRTSAGTGSPEDLTTAQATALLNVMVGDSGAGGTKGLVPAPAAGDATKFLTGAGTYVAVSGGGGGGGTVTGVSVTTANGISGSVANSATMPAISLTLGNITPTSVAATGTVTGSNLSGTNTGDQTNISGNAATATALQTARTINGVAFDGTANITISAAAAANLLTGTTLAAGVVSSSLTSVGTIVGGVWNGTAVAAAYGGTGQTSYVVGDILQASTTTALSRLTAVATGSALISGGVGAASSWGKIGLTTHVSGILPVANGGTGVTVSTGSGNNVLSTSPTLVTPVLGTPASGTLSNCIGLPVSTGISGLGTGVGSFLATPTSANLAAAVTGKTGSGALVFDTSPTITTPNIIGVATNSNAASGSVGELVESEILLGSAVTLTTAVPANVTSITLTAGDWDVEGNIAYDTSGGAVSVLLIGWISATSATRPAPPNKGAFFQLYPSTASTYNNVAQVGKMRISVASTTSVYLSTQVSFSTGTLLAYGYIGARRRR
jgi:hypothetical protein